MLCGMKLTQKTSLVVIALAALATAPLALSAMQGPPPHPPEGRPEGKPEGREHHESGGLEGSMQMLQSDTKKLDKALEKGDMDAVIKTTLEMQKAVHDGKTEMPEKAGTITDAKEKAAFVLGFRKQLISLEKSLLDLEVAALDGKTDDAKKIFNDTIKPMKKEGHAKYKD